MNPHDQRARYTISEQLSRVSLGTQHDNSENLRGLPSRNEAVFNPTTTTYENHASPGTQQSSENSAAPGLVSYSIFENTAPGETEAGLDPRKRKVICRACRYRIPPNKPSFQCLRCINYILCSECYLEALSSQTGFAKHHVAPPGDKYGVEFHEFEGIPPENVVVRNGRKMHWEPMISDAGEVSELFFRFIDVWVEYLDEFHTPGVARLASANSSLQTDSMWVPIAERPEVTVAFLTGSQAQKDEALERFSQQLRTVCQKARIRTSDDWVQARGTTPSQNIFIDRQGIHELWFLEMIQGEEYLHLNVIAMLDHMPPKYLNRLPPGRPHKALFPSGPLAGAKAGEYDIQMVDLGLFKFPPGRQLWPHVPRRQR